MDEIILTGFSGFIGKNYIKRQKESGRDIRLWDPRNVSATEYLDSCTNIAPGSAVVHLGSLSSVVESREYPEKALKANIASMLEVLELCRETRSHLVFSSTAVSFDPRQTSGDPARSTTACLGMSPYHQSKKVNEDLCRYYSQTFDLSCTILKLFSVYGSGVSDHSLLANVIRQLTSGAADVKIHGLSSVRDFVYIDDVTDAIEAALAFPNTGVSQYNVATGVGTTVRELVELIQATVGTNKKIIDVSTEESIDSQVVNTRPNPIEFQWTPAFSLADGIQKLVEECSQLKSLKDMMRGGK